MFYAGDIYNFILVIPTPLGIVTVTSPPTITVLDILNPGSPIVTGASMTLITGTNFIYFYSFTAPATTPRDYVAIYNYATSESEATGTATAATWANGFATYTFPTPLPQTAKIGNVLTVTGFTPSGFNVTAAAIVAVNSQLGQVKVPLASNPGSAESFNLTGNAQIIAGIPNVGTVQVTQITNGQINSGDTITIGSATTSNLNGSWIARTTQLDASTWTVTFNTTGTAFSSAAQSAGTLSDSIGLATIQGSGNFIATNTVSNQIVSLTDQLHIGDSNITGQVALQALVALNSTVAKDATVFKASSYIAPGADPTIQVMATELATVFTNSAAAATLLGTLSQGTLSGLIQDVYDYSFGSWNIDQTVNPPVLYIKRINGSVIASFELVNNSSHTQRNILTNPPESNV